MRLRGWQLVVAAALALAPSASAFSGEIDTVAGTGIQGYSGDGIPATMAELNSPPAVAPTPDGGFLIADFRNQRVRKVSSAGVISTIAGNGTIGYMGDNGPATAAELYEPRGVTPTPDGGFLIADRRNYVIRKVSATGVITTVAGNGTPGYIGDHNPATSAELRFPHAVSLTPDGGYLIVDTGNQVIRKVSPSGTITTVAGNGTFGYMGDHGPATAAKLGNPEGVAALPDGGFLIADTDNNVIRKVSASGVITTIAGTGTGGYNGDNRAATTAELNFPEGVAPTADGGFVFSDNRNNRIRRVSPSGTITTVAGLGTAGYSGDLGPATQAEFNTPEYVAITPSGSLLIADQVNGVIREVFGGVVPVIGPPVASTSPRSPSNHTGFRVHGIAPQGSFVALFTSATCSGPSLVSGSAASFRSPGFALHAAKNATIRLHAVVYAAGGQQSQCSRSTITYTEDSIAPKVTITAHSKQTVTTRSSEARIEFSFRSSERGSHFLCQLDHGSFHRCRSPQKYSLKPGHHTFSVRAVDRAGNASSPVTFRFKVVHRR